MPWPFVEELRPAQAACEQQTQEPSLGLSAS